MTMAPPAEAIAVFANVSGLTAHTGSSPRLQSFRPCGISR